MPRLTHLLADPQLAPSQTGLPRGTVDIRPVALPDIPAAAGQDTAAGLATLGEGLSAAGTGMRQQAIAGYQQAEMAARKKHAQDVLDAEILTQSAIQSLDTYAAESQRDPDRRGHPGRVQAYAEKLKGQFGTQLEKLDPLAQRKFLYETERHRSELNRRAEAFSFAADADKAKAALDNADSLFEQSLAAATTQAEREHALLRRNQTYADFVVAGWLYPEQEEMRKRQADTKVQIGDVQRAIQADPEGMVQQLRAQTRKEHTNPALPLAPPEVLPELTQKAGEVARSRFAESEHRERYADYQYTKRQEETERDIRARLSAIDPTPDNIGRYDQLLAEVNQKSTGLRPVIRDEAQREFTSHIRTLKAAAKRPRDVDDGPTERKLTIMIDAADNTRDLQAVRGLVVQNATLLKPETMKTFLATIRERERSDHYSNLPGVREGIRVIMGGDVAEGNYLAQMRGLTAEAEQVRLRTALDAYRTTIAERAAVSTTQANADAPQLALEIRRTYMELPAKEEQLKRLPLPLQGPDGKAGVEDDATAMKLIRDLPTTEAEKERVYRQWQRWRYLSPGGPGQRAPTASGASGTAGSSPGQYRERK